MRFRQRSISDAGSGTSTVWLGSDGTITVSLFMENRMKHLTGISALAAVMTCVVFAPASAAEWTSDNVTVDRPFGALDTRRAGDDFKGFWSGLTNEQRAEFRGRCGVIGNSDRYQTDARSLCNNLRAEDTFEGSNNAGATGAVGGNDQGGAGGGAGNAPGNAPGDGSGGVDGGAGAGGAGGGGGTGGGG
jgi:hypothetical protein